MKFEKLNENKIRITLTNNDLIENDIDFHSFMSNSSDAQNLFFHMLEKAEQEIGFVTRDYQVRVEALAMAGGDFVLTVTRFSPLAQNGEQDVLHNAPPRKKISVKRKKATFNSTHIAYAFHSFDDFCDLASFLYHQKLPDVHKIAKNVLLYSYHDTYYLVFTHIHVEYPQLHKLASYLTEFATYVDSSEIFVSKLAESGKLVMKNNALKIAMQHFVK